MEMSHTQALDAYNTTNLGIRGHSVVHVDESRLPGNDARLRPQRAQLDLLLDLIHKSNPMALPALLNPSPLLSQPRSEFYSMGTPHEAYFVVESASPIWQHIPGASSILEQRFGCNPTYNCSL
jgi:hypothetical protein